MKLGKFERSLYHVVAPLGPNGNTITGCSEHAEISRDAAREGIVLLKNDDDLLPLKRGKIVILGKAQVDFRKCGGGSGYVLSSNEVNIYDGLKNSDKYFDIVDSVSDYYINYIEEIKENDPNYIMGTSKEAPVPYDLIDEAKKETDTCIVTLVRYTEENSDPQDSDDEPYFSLSSTEKEMVECACNSFENVIVVINSGSVIDASFFAYNDKIKAAIMLWQPGNFGGEILFEILSGKTNPSGKLVDTIAKSIDDYPTTESFKNSYDEIKYTEDIFVGYRYFETIPGAKDKVIYPFGYGLSYTTFELSDIEMFDNGEKIFCNLNVQNTGSRAGKEVVQIYVQAPENKITKAKRVLVAYAKTPLIEPGDDVQVFLDFDISSLSSYDEDGKIEKSAYVLEKGIYRFYIGTSVRDTTEASYKYILNDDTVVEQLSSHMRPTTLGKKLLSDGSYETVKDNTPDFETRKCTYVCEDNSGKNEDEIYSLLDCYNDECTLDYFVSQISTNELLRLLAGNNTQSVSNTCGMGGNRYYGIPLLIACDGPAGVRVDRRCSIRTTCYPCATAIACTWNTDIAYKIGETGAREAKENNLQIWLTPALNIHRNPLCGRNFEYYSEDPFISGTMASSMVDGIQSENVIACPKHFACNNKETNRFEIDTIVSERALREIYLKGFEICVKTSSPKLIMTAYNTINGIRCAENTGMIYGILREEWGFDGLVTTDWSNHANAAEQLLAGNDINMPRPRPDKLIEYLNEGKIDRNMIGQSVKRLLEMILFVD